MFPNFNSAWRALVSDQRGGVAIVFALSLLPLFAAGGLAVDYAKAERLRSRLQAAADSAALAAGSALGLDVTGRIAHGARVFTSNISVEFGTITPNINIDGDGIVTVSAGAPSENSLMKVLGYDHIDVSVVSRSKGAGASGEIVLVLDYSSSMTSDAGGGKERWQAMRDAAIDMIERLTNGLPNPALKIGLVPFADGVYLSLPGQYVLGGTTGVTWSNCTYDRKWPYVREDTTPDTFNDETKWGRTDSNDTIDANEYSDCSNFSSRNLVVKPLTIDHSAVIAQLHAMTPHEGTNISAGMSIGWHVISPNEPFVEGADYNTGEKTIILLTDGEQTTESFGPGSSFEDSAGEQNLADMCTAAKAKGVHIITVAFSDDIGTSTLNRLKNCASSDDYFYNPQDGKGLANAFGEISKGLGTAAVLIK